MYRSIGEWMNGLTDRSIGEWMNGQMNRRMNEWMDGWTSSITHGQWPHVENCACTITHGQ